MKRNGAEIIVEILERQGVRTVAGIPGGANLPLYDALRDSSIHHVLARHEQGGAFMAQGIARVTRRAGVCLGTSGPGATNLLTAIADAKLDSIPLVIITGQVPLAMIGTDAFQEVDTYGLTLPITKHNFLARRPDELLHILPEAFRLAESGRPGPVVVDVPKDVQTGECEFDAWPEPWSNSAPAPCNPSEIDALACMIHDAKRPVLYIGGGILAAGCEAELAQLARRNSIPVICTLMGLGVFPADDPLYLGLLGMHGSRATNLALEEADLLIALGVRFDDRATGKVAAFCPQAKVAHIDIDASEIGKIRPADLSIMGDVGQALRQLLPLMDAPPRDTWRSRIAQIQIDFPPAQPDSDHPLHPIRLLREAARLLPHDTIITTDVGQHQMWTAQIYPFRHPRTWLTSGGLGTMGFGFPAAIGAALARPDRTVLCVTGDGSFLMNNQELATLAELGLNVKILLMNNGHLGLVRQQQELFYGERYHATRFEARTDYAALARCFGVKGVTLDPLEDPAEALARIFAQPGPCLIEAPIPENANVYPMVPPGAANRDTIGGTVHA
ncbi:biosynthetic-type acetolactate synthase large subunit [bacterium]|nr:biosynthetic-type acetolactate synthase large subunit [bacterium]